MLFQLFVSLILFLNTSTSLASSTGSYTPNNQNEQQVNEKSDLHGIRGLRKNRKQLMAANGIVARVANGVTARNTKHKSKSKSSKKSGKRDGGGASSGVAVSAYWVIFNNPETCLSNNGGLPRCGNSDWENADSAVLHAAGGISNTNGSVRLASSIIRSSSQQDLILDEQIDPFQLHNGWTNEDAEVGLLVIDHGPVITYDDSSGNSILDQLLTLRNFQDCRREEESAEDQRSCGVVAYTSYWTSSTTGREPLIPFSNKYNNIDDNYAILQHYDDGLQVYIEANLPGTVSDNEQQSYPTTLHPIVPTVSPTTQAPMESPTDPPTRQPVEQPTDLPTRQPVLAPSDPPTRQPVLAPSASPNVPEATPIATARVVCPIFTEEGSCSVCGDGKAVGETNAVFIFDGHPEVNCGVLQFSGVEGYIPLADCALLPDYISDTCDCVPCEPAE